MDEDLDRELGPTKPPSQSREVGFQYWLDGLSRSSGASLLRRERRLRSRSCILVTDARRESCFRIKEGTFSPLLGSP